jgi:class 3 adenylate cyclase
MTLPSGIVTFLFTDIESSTRLWESYPEAMEAASSQHDHLMREVIEKNGGQVVKSTGDGFHAVFSSASDAAGAALEGQSSIQNQEWGLPEPVRVRMGLHSGEAQLRDGDYFGSAVNRGARLMAAGSGSQVLLSDVTAKLIRENLPDGADLVDLGEYNLRDLSVPERVFQLNGAGLQVEFPELKTAGSTRNNLPESLTTFVGRERESAEVKPLADPDWCGRDRKDAHDAAHGKEPDQPIPARDMVGGAGCADRPGADPRPGRFRLEPARNPRSIPAGCAGGLPAQ